MTGGAIERRFERDRGPSLGAAPREALVLLALAAVLTLVSWALRGDRLSPAADPAYYELELAATLVAPGRALELYEAGDHRFVDVRPGDPGTTVPGAFLVREDSFDDDLLRNFDFMTPADPLVVFGGGDLSAASNVAGRLQDRGWTDVVIRSGGLSGWAAAGGPVSERPDPPAPAPDDPGGGS